MDQRKDVYDYQSKCSIDINELIKFAGNEKKKVARRRWAILAKALKEELKRFQNSQNLTYYFITGMNFFRGAKSLVSEIFFSCLKELEEADYWVSQERKYCDFCKCWIANNRPSVEFHEKGRRHQENVKKRLKTITKNSFKAQRELEKEDVTLKQMEKAALEAYKKDIENNADITSVAINKKLKDENLEIKGSTKIWHQLKSKEGDVYYWNTVTNGTSWEPPTEGFLSLEDQREESFVKAKKELEAAEKESQKQGLIRAQQLKQEAEEERARLAREKLKERRVVDDLPPQRPAPIIEPGNPSPYGRWETIKETPVVDFQLPEQEYYEPPIVYEPEPIVKEFKEKTVESLGGEDGETTFKKRKAVFGNRKNARQRVDD